MSTSPHRLIHASAGTGKTWQLSGRFLELVFAGVEPRRILATTFTRSGDQSFPTLPTEQPSCGVIMPDGHRRPLALLPAPAI